MDDINTQIDSLFSSPENRQYFESMTTSAIDSSKNKEAALMDQLNVLGNAQESGIISQGLAEKQQNITQQRIDKIDKEKVGKGFRKKIERFKKKISSASERVTAKEKIAKLEEIQSELKQAGKLTPKLKRSFSKIIN